MPRLFSSVREAWNGVLSGTVAPSTQRPVSCSTIDTPPGGGSCSSLPRVQPQAAHGISSVSAAESKDEDPFECSVFVRLADDDDNNEEIDISALTDDDLRRLKRKDPFLYYSIPAVRRRAIRTTRSASSRRCSLPAEVLAEADIAQSRKRQEVPTEEPRRRESVRRNRRFSTEAHPSLVCDEILRELQELDDSDIDEDLEILERELDGL